jgi:hypothetical protein
VARKTKLAVAMLSLAGGPASLSYAQSIPKFEVAAIKPCKETEPGQRGGGGNSSPGRLNVKCDTVKGLSNEAYLLFGEQPEPGNDAWFDAAGAS